ncbi:hemolysin family protein [Anaplasma capra]|uniref:hemolysin family protein n=1 Tax=Anaplasma capra TaxID=1562740 RepID=UPI0021D6011B|nr:hemolysin family protein [Anaplasma capra]MCU7611192.1 hemolysin family protein [Anaplasma capra]MCU7612304.1 hemolysin family protein [Anaplasma capra]
MGSKISEESEGGIIPMLSSVRSYFYSFILGKLPGFKEFVRNEIMVGSILHFDGSNIMSNVIRLDECSVKDIMVQRSEILALGIDDDNLLVKVLKSQHTRVPIYKDNIDNIIGFIHIKDIMSREGLDFNVKDIIHNVMYVPHSMKAANLFIKMQSSRVHMAIVLDEYGSTDGLVTMADIIEEIVGDIEDEHDVPSIPDIVNISNNKIEVNARVLVRTLEQSLRIALRDSEEEEYVTVGGLILAMVGRVPIVDEVFHHKSGASFLIKEVDSRCIYRVVIDLSNVPRNQ